MERNLLSLKENIEVIQTVKSSWAIEIKLNLWNLKTFTRGTI